MFRSYKNMINRFMYEPSSYTRLLLRQNQTKYAFQISLVFGKADSNLPIPSFTYKLWVVLLANLPFLPPSYKAFRQKCDRSFIILSQYYLFTLLNEQCFFIYSIQAHYCIKEKVKFCSPLQKNVICRVGFLYWERKILFLWSRDWVSKELKEILHFSRLQFHACFQITLDAQVLTHSAHFCWPSSF